MVRIHIPRLVSFKLVSFKLSVLWVALVEEAV